MRDKQRSYTGQKRRFLVYNACMLVWLLMGSLFWSACASASNSSSAPDLSSVAPRPSPAVRASTPVGSTVSPLVPGSTPVVPGETPTASVKGVSPQLSCTVVPLRQEDFYSRGFVLKCSVRGAPASDTSFSLQQAPGDDVLSKVSVFMCSGQLSNGSGICGRQIVVSPFKQNIGAGILISGTCLPSHIRLGPVAPAQPPVNPKAPPA